MIYSIFNMILSQINFQTVILIKLATSLIYLAFNYITHEIKLPVTFTNVLRLMISVFDFAILLMLLLIYILEGCAMAFASSNFGVLFAIILCANSWLVLVRHQKVRAVFIITVFSLCIVLILHLLFFCMGLMYKRPMAALYIFNITYIACWLVFDAYPKAITRFTERVGERLAWIDPLDW